MKPALVENSHLFNITNCYQQRQRVRRQQLGFSGSRQDQDMTTIIYVNLYFMFINVLIY